MHSIWIICVYCRRLLREGAVGAAVSTSPASSSLLLLLLLLAAACRAGILLR
jgi:hypothetical protein